MQDLRILANIINSNEENAKINFYRMRHIITRAKVAEDLSREFDIKTTEDEDTCVNRA